MEKLNQHPQPNGIELAFSCQEDLHAMPTSVKGKFCSSCKREVIDFTRMSFAEIQQIRGTEAKTCGIFLPEQIEPSLHPIELPKVRSWAFLSSVLLSLNLGNAVAQSTVDPKVEQSQGTSNAPNLTPQAASEKSKNGEHISLTRAQQAEVEEMDEPETTDKQTEKIQRKRMRQAKKKFYWSKRFPFIHRRHWRRVGKF